MQSFLDHGHAYQLYTYSPELKVPSGVEVKNAAELFDPDAYFTYKSGRGAGSHAAFSNLFRYKLLAERGGWWVDTDVVCLTSDIPNVDEFFAYESDKIINGAVLFFKQGDPLMLDCLTKALKIGSDATWGQIGPRLITERVIYAGRETGAQPQFTCYPVNHHEALDLVRPTKAAFVEARTENSFFVHFWNEIFRRARISKHMLPPSGSFLRALVDRHSIVEWTGEYNEEAIEGIMALESALREAQKEIRTLLKRAQKNESKLPKSRALRTSQGMHLRLFERVGALVRNLRLRH